MNAANRVVVDTGVLISAALRLNSLPRQAYLKALEGFELCASVETLAELERVLYREKFDRYLPLAERLAFLETYRASVEVFEVTLQVADCRDPKDNPFLALALTVEAKLLISSDPDLYTLNPYRGIPILRPAEFLYHSS
mgnify:CR=1 FL=1|jgi:putative PIN family toxin of toxin-antitoxin system